MVTMGQTEYSSLTLRIPYTVLTHAPAFRQGVSHTLGSLARSLSTGFSTMSVQDNVNTLAILAVASSSIAIVALGAIVIGNTGNTRWRQTKERGREGGSCDDQLVVAGLVNFRNNCFLNAALQVVGHIFVYHDIEHVTPESHRLLLRQHSHTAATMVANIHVWTQSSSLSRLICDTNHRLWIFNCHL